MTDQRPNWRTYLARVAIPRAKGAIRPVLLDGKATGWTARSIPPSTAVNIYDPDGRWRDSGFNVEKARVKAAYLLFNDPEAMAASHD
jgi:hypothetical protein